MEKFKQINSEHPYLEMPEIESHSYLIEWLFDVGPVMQSSMGSSPLTFQEIDSWADDIEISHWEKSTLKKLSSEYLSWLHQGSKKDCLVPYVANAPTKEHLSQVANSLLAGFMSMAEAGNKSSGLGKIKK